MTKQTISSVIRDIVFGFVYLEEQNPVLYRIIECVLHISRSAHADIDDDVHNFCKEIIKDNDKLFKYTEDYCTHVLGVSND
jgi:hypothetical protein